MIKKIDTTISWHKKKYNRISDAPKSKQKHKYKHASNMKYCPWQRAQKLAFFSMGECKRQLVDSLGWLNYWHISYTTKCQ